MLTRTSSTSRLLLTVCIISFVSFLGSYMRIPIVALFAFHRLYYRTTPAVCAQ